MKTPYLAVHDYGTGGIWMYIDASSPEAITRMYPELKVFESPPDFVSAETLARIREERRFDLDAPPTGYLADLVTARETKET